MSDEQKPKPIQVSKLIINGEEVEISKIEGNVIFTGNPDGESKQVYHYDSTAFEGISITKTLTPRESYAWWLATRAAKAKWN